MTKAIAITGKCIPPATLAELQKSFETVVLPPDPLIDPRVGSHPDMLLTVFGGNMYCHIEYYRIAEKQLRRISQAGGLKTVLSSCKRSPKYPEDTAFNALTAGELIIGRKASLCPELPSDCILDTRQGYAACTSLFVAGTVLSADPSVLASANRAGLDAFKLPGGGVNLPGYDTGFIGGACGVLDNKIYICGDPSLSEAGKALSAFCRSRGISLISLCDDALLDIGGIKFVPTAEDKQIK